MYDSLHAKLGAKWSGMMVTEFWWSGCFGDVGRNILPVVVYAYTAFGLVSGRWQTLAVTSCDAVESECRRRKFQELLISMIRIPLTHTK